MRKNPQIFSLSDFYSTLFFNAYSLNSACLLNRDPRVLHVLEVGMTEFRIHLHTEKCQTQDSKVLPHPFEFIFEAVFPVECAKMIQIQCHLAKQALKKLMKIDYMYYVCT